MYVLGISCYFHDSAAVLLRDGELVAAIQEERLSRRKHDPAFPTRAIAFCLEQGGIGPADLDFVAFYEKPLLKLERLLMTSLGTFGSSYSVFREASLAWSKQRLWIKDRILRELQIPADRLLFVEHHMSHAASSFFCSPFKEAAILTVDGVGEWATATVGSGVADWDGGVNRIQLTHEMRFPHSLGLLYSVFTDFLGFEVNEGEYKVMGMAQYGKPCFLDEVHRIARLADDGSLVLDMDYFAFHKSSTRNWSPKFQRLFGEPRQPQSQFVTETTGGEADAASKASSQRYADIAASIQRFTEEAVVKMANHAFASTGRASLCMAGGVALNSMANARLLRETPFRELFVQPAAGDSGGALGAALYAWHVLLGKPRKFVLEHAYWGRSPKDSEIAQMLEGQGARFRTFENEDNLVNFVVDHLLDGKVVGWFQGRDEWGPRALGNRSILADPRRAEMKDVVNRKIKFREPFRPFAPVVPESCAQQLFDAPREVFRQYPARYMLLVLPWKEDIAAKVPAVSHAGTGRLQTLRREWNPRYDALLQRFSAATGTPVLLNTSFNLRGEPIVCTPQDAWKTFQSSGLDLLVLENFVISKEGTAA
jgi:carbamoyltransferase